MLFHYKALVCTTLQPRSRCIDVYRSDWLPKNEQPKVVNYSVLNVCSVCSVDSVCHNI